MAASPISISTRSRVTRDVAGLAARRRRRRSSPTRRASCARARPRRGSCATGGSGRRARAGSRSRRATGASTTTTRFSTRAGHERRAPCGGAPSAARAAPPRCRPGVVSRSPQTLVGHSGPPDRAPRSPQQDRSASSGPCEPAGYVGSGPGCPASQAWRIGSMIDHCALDLVVAREQRRVAAHRVEDQPLVGLRRLRHERRAVEELHVHRADAHPRCPGSSRPSESETPSLGCMRQDELVGLHADRARADWKARCGTGLSVTAISVTLRASRLPVRR